MSGSCRKAWFSAPQPGAGRQKEGKERTEDTTGDARPRPPAPWVLLGLRLRGVELAPALRVDLALHELATVGRYEVEAVVAFLRSLRLLLILHQLLLGL